MKTKWCYNCVSVKNISDFCRNKAKKDGLHDCCKNCKSNNAKKYRIANKDILKKQRKNKYIKNKMVELTKMKEYYLNNKETISIYKKQWQEENKENKKSYDKEYRLKNINQIRVTRNNYTITRRKIDINYKIICTLRNRLGRALRGNLKIKTTLELIGCSIEILKQHLESKFTEGMDWNNHSLHGWHIDHIRPCASFDLSNTEQQKQCFHYTNLQPLWAEENLKKSDKLI